MSREVASSFPKCYYTVDPQSAAGDDGVKINGKLQHETPEPDPVVH